MRGTSVLIALSMVVAWAFAADAPKAPDVDPASKAAIAVAERDIVSIGRQMEQMVAQYKDLQQKDQAAQAAMQDAVQAAYNAAGDPKKEKFDLNADKIVFTVKTAPAKEAAPAPVKK